MVYKIDLLNSICTDNLGGTGGHVQNITALNEWCVLAGGTGGHRFDISAYNELSTLYGGTGGYKYDIDALNEICVLSGGTGGHRFAVDALVELGALLNQYPAVLDDGNTVAWYDYTAADTITKDGSNIISEWRDKFGNTQAALKNSTPAWRPLWSEEGVIFGTSYKFLKSDNFTLNQPITIYLITKQITWISGGRFFDGSADATVRFFQSGASPEVCISAGTTSNRSNQLLLDQFALIRIVFNGANSKLQINDNTPITGNFGLNNMGGITISRSGSLATAWCNQQLKEAIFRNSVDSDQDYTKIGDYLKKKSNIDASGFFLTNEAGDTVLTNELTTSNLTPE